MTPRLACLALLLLTSACRTPSGTGPYEPSDPGLRSTVEAERLTREAADVAATDLERAEALLREALTADLFYGPAHNNLGVVFLQQDRLYEAANEFEWARKLMPGSADPRMNLGLTLERAGRTQEALDGYSTAMEVAPEHVPTQQALARLLLRSGREREDLDRMLGTIALRGETPEWRDWAREQLVRRGQ